MRPEPPSKRHASRSPEGKRASKRPATSSPEEGEVSQSISSTALASSSTPLPRSLPAKPSVLPTLPSTGASKVSVPFPFKKKAAPAVTNGSIFNVLAAGPKELPAEPEPPKAQVVYERSKEEEQKIKEHEEDDVDKRKNGRPPPKVDRWMPGPSDRLPGASSYYPDHRDHRDRNRDRPRSPSPNGAYQQHRRSVSPSSPLKHRLPVARSPPQSFSPLSRNRDSDRDRDRPYDRPREYWDTDRDRDYRHRRDTDHYSSWNGVIDDADRSYRSGQNSGKGDNRDWTRRREPHEYDYRAGDRGRGGHARGGGGEYNRTHDIYVPRSNPSVPPSGLISPGAPAQPPPPPSHLPARPASPPPEPSESTVPRPPSVSPPPPPPPDLRLKDVVAHPRVLSSTPLKKPGAPKDAHSPPPMVPPPKEEYVRQNQERERQKGWEAERKDAAAGEASAQHRRAVWKKEPKRRPREEEEKVYGKMFVGCGLQSDYEATTKLGEGTFGEVHKAIHKSTLRPVALKRILMHNEKEGMPVTALREIKILKALKHPCIVDILDMFVVRSSEKDPLSVYMVFPYMDHDLAGLLENERVKLTPSQIKLYMKQLLEGTEYMHRNHILHRDMKAANLLISNTGSLRIADFGLARSFDENVAKGVPDSRGKERKYTNCVVTRWYRPPELLLGARQYGGEVDIWGIGCVFGEMFMRRPILPGTSDLDQLEKIWNLCGTPNQHTWPNFDALPGCEGVSRFPFHPRIVKQVYESSAGPETSDLLDKLLICNPKDRITASDALDHDYFWTDPLPADPKTLPTYEASHEFDKRSHQRHHHHAPAGIPPQQVPPPLHLGRGGSNLPQQHFQQGHGPGFGHGPPGFHPQGPNLPPPRGMRGGMRGGGGFNYSRGQPINHGRPGGDRQPPYWGQPPPGVWQPGDRGPPGDRQGGDRGPPHGPPWPSRERNVPGWQGERGPPYNQGWSAGDHGSSRQPPAGLPPRPPVPMGRGDPPGGYRGHDRRIEQDGQSVSELKYTD